MYSMIFTSLSFLLITIPAFATEEKSCPEYSPPLCEKGEKIITQVDAEGCPVPYCAPTQGALDDKKFCREIVRDGSFGQPKGKAKHCLTFFNGKVSDNAHTFFGNPPETLPYQLKKNRIFILRQGDWSEAYRMVNGEIHNSAGAVLKEESN